MASRARPPMLPDGEMVGGQVLGGRYRLDRRQLVVGEVSIWAGEDETLSRPVTVYVMPPNHPRTDALLGAARQAAQATDTRFLRVLDALPYGPSEPVTFVVCESLPGVTLHELLRAGPLPGPDAAWITHEVAQALIPIHEAGLSHGKLDPDAVLIATTGAIRIKGFLIDAVLEGQADDLADRERADVAAIGCLLYAGLTGAWPGGSSSGQAGLAPAQDGLPPARFGRDGLVPPATAQPGVSKSLDAICMQTLQPRPDATPLRSAAAIALALGRALTRPASDESGTDPEVDLAARVKASLAGGEVSPSGERVRSDGETARSDGDAEAGESTNELSALDQTAEMTGPTAAMPGGDEANPAPARSSGPGSPGSPPGGAPSPAVLPGAPKFTRSKRSFLKVGARSASRGVGAWPGWWWIAPVVAVALVIVLIAKGCSGASSSGPSPQAVTVTAVAAFNAAADGGDGNESPDQVALATDGDPTTCWTTRTYPDDYIPSSKPGVGLVLDFGTAISVATLNVTVGATPVDVSVLIPQGDAANTDTAPMTSVKDWTSVLAMTIDTTPVTLALPDAPRTRFVLLYLTKLPEVPNKGPYQQASICEVTATGMH